MGGILGVDHPKVSFLIAKRILDQHLSDEIPEQRNAKRLILHAIAVHQGGANYPEASSTDKYTATSDRLELTAARGWLRMSEVDAEEENRPIGWQGYNDRYAAWLPFAAGQGDSLLAIHAESYCRALYDAADENTRRLTDHQRAVTAAALLFASSHNQKLQSQIFAPEMRVYQNGETYEYDPKQNGAKKLLLKHIWNEAWKEFQSPEIRSAINRVRQQHPTTLDLVLTLTMRPGDTPDDYPNLADQVSQLSPEESEAWAQAYAYMIVKYELWKAEQTELAAWAENTFPPNHYLAILTKFATNKLQVSRG